MTSVRQKRLQFWQRGRWFRHRARERTSVACDEIGSGARATDGWKDYGSPDQNLPDIRRTKAPPHCLARAVDASMNSPPALSPDGSLRPPDASLGGDLDGAKAVPGRNTSVDFLRGIAAVMVCFCHFRLAWPEPMRDFAKSFGELGVEVFFVISGYIIPYSMDRGGYRWVDFGRFWLKRLLRLQPTFLVALLLTGVMSFAAAAVKGGGIPALEPLAMLRRALYLEIPPENPVIWTLIVELKYYVAIALLFPVLFSHSAWLRRSAFLAGAAIAVCGPLYFDWCKYLPFFLIGFCGCFLVTRRVGRLEFILLVAVALAAALVRSTLPQIAAAILTCGAILRLSPGNWRVAGLYGSISYSLYLVHFPLGVKFLNLVLPRTTGTGLHILLGLVTMAGCTTVAYVFFRYIEKPSAEWSQKIRFAARQRAGARTGAAAREGAPREGGPIASDATAAIRPSGPDAAAPDASAA